MGSAIMNGILNSGLCTPRQITASAHTQATLKRLSHTYGIQVTLDNRQVAQSSDIVFLAVKPHLYKSVIKEIRDCVDEDKLIDCRQ